MLFAVNITVNLPKDMDAAALDDLKEREKKRAVELQKAGKFVHLWRVAGKYANLSIFDVESNDELHDVLMSLPMFPYFDLTVTPLATHPSAIR